MQKIQELLELTKQWQIEHRKAGRQIDAAFCAIRADAIKDVLKILEEEKKK